MKRNQFLILLLALALPTFIFAQSNLKIAIKSEKFSLNNVSISPDWLISNAKSQLGEPARMRDGYNITHTYDNAGIVLFEIASNKKATGVMSEFQIHFYVSAPNEVTPKNTFDGFVKIDKLKAGRNTDRDTMMKKLKKWKKTESFLENSYRMTNGEFYIYFQFSKDEQLLEKISIGKNKK